MACALYAMSSAEGLQRNSARCQRECLWNQSEMGGGGGGGVRGGEEPGDMYWLNVVGTV